MFAIPPNLSPEDGEQPAQLGCVECPGTLVVTAQGDHAYLLFTCRIGHRYSVDDLFAGKEKAAEDRLWAAVLAFEEIAALANDVGRHGSQHGWWDDSGEYADRATRAAAVAAALRRVVEHDRPIPLAEPPSMPDQSDVADAP